MAIELVLYDMGGLLLDGEALHLEANRLFVANPIRDDKFQFTQADIDFMIGPSDKVTLEYLMKKYDFKCRLADFLKEREETYLELADDRGVELMDYAKESIRYLQERNIRLGLVSSSVRRIIDKNLEVIGLTDVFEHSIAGDEVDGKLKPSRMPYQTIRRRFGVKAMNTLALEDSGSGVLSASKARIKVIAVPNEYTKNQKFDIAYNHNHLPKGGLREVVESGFCELIK